MSSPIDSYLAALHARYADLSEGAVATYIPELASADPAWFGICVAATDGRVYEVGDTRQPFTIQSISKPFVYGMALQDRGRAAVLAKIGVEPTGDAFNSISLAPGTGCPLNPMINAGAIAASSLVAGRSDEDRRARVLATLSIYAGRGLSLDEAVYVSERDTGHRNRAIAHMLRNFEVIPDDPEPALDRYFRQCSVSVTCRDLALMAATLANGGVHPKTGERALAAEYVQDVLSVMTTCGMYDYAGQWTYRVGLPAKSGVGGGILAALPGQLGIAVFSPRLDEHGNSVRGVRVCHDLSQDLGLHFLAGRELTPAPIRLLYGAREIASKRQRSEAEREALAALGNRVRTWELQGELAFAAIEVVIRQVTDAAPGLDFAVLDIRRVTHVTGPAGRLLGQLARGLAARGKRVLFAGAGHHSRLLRELDADRAEGEAPAVLVFADTDLALEWCEERLLGARKPPDDAPLPLSAYALFRGLDAAALARLDALLVREAFQEGELIIRGGDLADRLYLLARGEVSVTIDLPSGQRHRLATLSAGACFGEMGLIERGQRSADVRADTAGESLALSFDDWDRLGASEPALQAALLQNLLRTVVERVDRLTREVAALTRHADPRAGGGLRVGS